MTEPIIRDAATNGITSSAMELARILYRLRLLDIPLSSERCTDARTGSLGATRVNHGERISPPRADSSVNGWTLRSLQIDGAC
jgi:hypothetical protein